ncbi:MAG: hypothetical protein JNM24_04740 [Bdellovibrionaceae bacterium]|nr:hypothetical protein [Pseudobdellovibrionaceae bacterium]
MKKRDLKIQWSILLISLAFMIWIFHFSAHAKKETGKIVPCDENKSRPVIVSMGRITVLNFPVKPKEIVQGESHFDFKQIKNDLVIKPLRTGARTNVVVYLPERRCAFDLRSTTGGSDDLILVRDPKDSQMEVKFHD